MQFALIAAIVFIVAFLLGSIPCGVLVGKAFYGIDPRNSGSKSIGATNVNRTMGTKAGAGVMVLDMLKGAIAVAVARIVAWKLGYDAGSFNYDLLVFVSTALGIGGHIYSPWLGFKGGKGISAGFGTLIVADWRIGLGILVVFLIFAVLTRIISVGSMCAAFSVFVFALVLHWPSAAAIVPCAIIAFFVIFAHRANLGRLMRHEEPKFSVNKGKEKKHD